MGYKSLSVGKEQAKNEASFSKIFIKYFDNVVIGIIAGLVVFYGLKINNGLLSALYIFLSALVLIILYSVFVWAGEKYPLNKILKGFIKKHWKLLTYIIIAGYIYSAIHELLHYYFITSFGYSAKFCWACFPTRVIYLTSLNEVLRGYYFISAIAPYLLSIILLICLLFLFLLIKRKILIILAITPFLDTFVNIFAIPLAYFTKSGNDFLNLFRLSFWWETIIIMLSPIVLYLILLNIYKKYRGINKNG